MGKSKNLREVTREGYFIGIRKQYFNETIKIAEDVAIEQDCIYFLLSFLRFAAHISYFLSSGIDEGKWKTLVCNCQTSLLIYRLLQSRPIKHLKVW